MIILRKVDKLAACQRNGGRQSRALSTDRILGHLYQQTLTFADQLFDRAVLAVFLPRSFDVKHMQKSRAFQPDIHKGRLHTREHPQHLADIDVADKAAAGGSLNVEILQDAVDKDRHTRLARRAIDQNILNFLHGSLKAAAVPYGRQPHAKSQVSMVLRF